MCGIIGYIGSREAAGILLNGLRRLEYRGYDSAGLAVFSGGIERRRSVGKVAGLAEQITKNPAAGTTGIAHTRWATHGAPTLQNAHPHLDASGKIALVHNGIIENHASIRVLLEQHGIKMSSETDTETLVQLIGYHYRDEKDFELAVRSALSDVRGTFGIIVVHEDLPDCLIVARRGSPLLIGIGDDEHLIASDAAAIIEHTKRVVYLEDNEMAVIDRAGCLVTTIDAVPVSKTVETLEVELEQIELQGFEHYMAKEIHEQPESIRNTLRGRIDAQEGMVRLGGLKDQERQLASCRRVVLTGCGTAWHAGLVGEYLFEELVRIPTEVEYASELRYRNPVVEQDTLSVVVSQSGETLDTLAALREMRTKGATVLGVVNVVGSTIARETENGVYLHAGPEIGVASTKAFTSQVAVLTMLSILMGRMRHLSVEATSNILIELLEIPKIMERVLAMADEIKSLTERYVDRENWLYLGRGISYPVALEGALKLKEISYIHAEGLPAAEMKHGPIALIEEGMPVVVVAPHDHTYEKVLGNIAEVKGRGGHIIAIASEGDELLSQLADEILYVPEVHPLLSPMVTTVPLQLIAYSAAVARGKDVDMPRNLAKSVTVE